ncbi:MAG: hypothetical protein HYS19_06185 [Nitrosomonadales bacterium]|nr:hypothetical protein [Nitrosomonadales bacterium]
MNPHSSLAFANFRKMHLFSDGELDIRLGKISPEEYFSTNQAEIDHLTNILSPFASIPSEFEWKIRMKYDANAPKTKTLEEVFSNLDTTKIFIWDWFQVDSYDILVRNIINKPVKIEAIINLHNHIHFIDSIVLKSLARMLRNIPVIQASPPSSAEVSNIPNESFDSVVLLSDSLVRIPAMIEKLTRSLFMFANMEYPKFPKVMKGRGNFGGLPASFLKNKLEEKASTLFTLMGNRRNDEVHELSDLPNFLDNKDRVIGEIFSMLDLYKHFQVFYLLSLAVIVETYH